MDGGSSGGGEAAWCLHCPNAYCPAHRSALSNNPELGRICDQHEDEIEFLLDTMRAGPGRTLTMLLPLAGEGGGGLTLNFVGNKEVL